jgi:uncharacterized protein (DUF1697 family)
VTAFIALLRAVNVGGTGKLAMADLVRLCGDAGLRDARTYIASGNVVFQSDLPEAAIKHKLEAALRDNATPTEVMIRSARQMADVLARNPFADALPNQVAVIFLDAAPSADLLEGVTRQGDERIVAGEREIYVHYPSGMGSSRLVIPAARAGTARNMNTVAKLAAMAEAL